MRTIMLMLAALLLASTSALAQESHQAVHGDSGQGAETITTVLTPSGTVQSNCTGVSGCGSFIASPTPTTPPGAQAVHTMVSPSGQVQTQCVNSPACSTGLFGD